MEAPGTWSCQLTAAPGHQSDSALACSSAPHPSDPQPPNLTTKFVLRDREDFLLVLFRPIFERDKRDRVRKLVFLLLPPFVRRLRREIHSDQPFHVCVFRTHNLTAGRFNPALETVRRGFPAFDSFVV